jgi:pimeloyl-ACP methyl ester carboxylesterase
VPRRTPATLALLAVLAACSGDDQPTPASAEATPTTVADRTAPVSGTDEPAGSMPPTATVTSAGPTFDPAPIEWEPFNDAIDVATLDVPLDYDDPAGERVELALARYRALEPDQRIGTLLVNPGGPGFGGTGLAFNAAGIYDTPLRERFDIVGWDPRGTGDSEPAIDCIDSFDPYFTGVDSTPTDAAEREALVDLAEEFAAACLERTPELAAMGTNNSARDIDSIRRALGEDTISYFGFSYGSELGATWATLFPDTVRAAVLDGAADPTASMAESNEQQLAGFESTLASFLAQCSADPECEFHNDGDAETAFDELMAALDAEPAPTVAGRPPANRDIAQAAVAVAMYAEERWPSLAKSLAAAADGDGSGLLALFDAYYNRSPDGTWGDELEAFRVISCMDDAERPTVAESDAAAARFEEVAPRFVGTGAAGDYKCTFFPPSTDPRVDVSAAGAGPIVVIGTTGDPATPLASTRAMSEALDDGRLVVVTADQHTGYGVNRCVIDLVNAYLVDLEPPADGTECE